jgi:hypothetical protein
MRPLGQNDGWFMSTQVLCPDCGKLIAAAGSVDDAARCRCAEKEEERSAPPPKEPRTCYVCGADLHGQKRYRDKMGRYWCGDCADAEERALEREQQMLCPDCSRLFSPKSLVEYGGIRICRTCYRGRIDEAHRKIKRLSAAASAKRAEINRIKWMAILLAILLVIGTLAQILW